MSADPDPRLRRSGLVQLCVELLASHFDDGTGHCAGCGQRIAACAVRRNVRRVLAAAGLRPDRFDIASVVDRCAYVRHEILGGHR